VTEHEAPGAVISIAAAVVVDVRDRLLVVRKRGTSSFMQPGGKIEPGETALAALQREVLEELNVCIVPTTVRPLGRFCAPAAHEPDHVDAALFIVELAGDPRPSAEIEEIAWLDPQSPSDSVDLAPLTRNIVCEYLWSSNHVDPARQPLTWTDLVGLVRFRDLALRPTPLPLTR
jgi:8-oxo-dGTP diphosphatase